MTDLPYVDDDQPEDQFPTDLTETAAGQLKRRCDAAKIEFEDDKALPRCFVIKMKSGRSVRRLYIWNYQSLVELLSFNFEEYTYLSELEAICSYCDGTIEAGLQSLIVGLNSMSLIRRRLFGVDTAQDGSDSRPSRLRLNPRAQGLPIIELGEPSDHFKKLCRSRLSIRLLGCSATTHDAALELLKKMADATLFQLDLLTEFPLTLERQRLRTIRRSRSRRGLASDLQYPVTEFDGAPLSLYWYGRSATSMPLLQFLAYYQVIEFYFPIYSKSEAQRRVKSILKDPTFRSDRDVDVAKLLAAIQVSRAGGFGDERSQLRATLAESIDADALRQFLESDSDRKEFILTKSKALPYHRIPLANPTADLRNDVADRIYDIRCKIVHTKTDSRDSDLELLLPFSREADQLSFDIELVHYLAQRLLVIASRDLNLHR
ncbi:MAG TPA: hypothetical protein VN750_10035 [Steroidobacteraceae bacterium]|nr:hypothetical protein [Steroidobacteraceae bacterium]